MVGQPVKSPALRPLHDPHKSIQPSYYITLTCHITTHPSISGSSKRYFPFGFSCMCIHICAFQGCYMFSPSNALEISTLLNGLDSDPTSLATCLVIHTSERDLVNSVSLVRSCSIAEECARCVPGLAYKGDPTNSCQHLLRCTLN
jgi:hypothetical protein